MSDLDRYLTDEMVESAAGWIAERRRFEQAATEGPWRAAVVARYVDDDGRDRGKGGIYPAGPMGPPPLFVTPDWVAADAALIADSRTSLPKALDALEAVLREHPRVGIFEPCIPGECDGHEVNHDHMETDGGEWVHVDERVGWVCTICRYDDGEPFDWPCTTVRVITDALGVES